ncbi:MAG: hypothetical protein IAE97_13165 [Chthoniobacterales bacterium]|nr:hypothetical protein [Chthoniobacterales bacterium]
MSKKKASTARRKARSAPPHGAAFVAFNVNDYVQVRLTDYGRQCLRDNYEKPKAAYAGKLGFDYSPPKEDKDGWSRWQAWSLMKDLGPHISMGMNPPFETTIRIEVERPNGQDEGQPEKGGGHVK